MERIRPVAIAVGARSSAPKEFQEALRGAGALLRAAFPARPGADLLGSRIVLARASGTRVGLAVACALAVVLCVVPGAWAHDPADEDIVQQVTFSGETLTMRLHKVALRGPHFQYRVQQAGGAYVDQSVGLERAYLGTVDERPDALASGVIVADGSLWGQIVFDRGATWFTRGATVSGTRGLTAPAVFKWPTRRNVDAGMVGATTYRWEFGLDFDNAWWVNRAGSSATTAFDLVEYSMSNIRAVYLADGLLVPALGRVIMRASAADDPYAGLTTGGMRLNAVRAEWQANQTDAGVDMAHVVTSAGGGGLAFLVDLNPAFSYAWDGGASDGTFDVVARHEAGHNWRADDNHAGGPEGATVMEGNQYARFGGPELYAIMLSRNARIGSLLDNLGTWTSTQVPPYAGLDLVDGVAGSGEVTVDVLANDHDANADGLHLVGADATSLDGGQVSVVGDTLRYRPPLTLDGANPDRFSYRIADETGKTATGVVVARHGRPFFSGEAEAATRAGGAALQSSRRYYSATGYVNINGAAGRTITWTFDLPIATDVTLAFQYHSAAAGTAEVRVNGTVVAANHAFPTATLPDWPSSAPLTVSLPAGPVTVRIASTSAIGPEIDLLRATWNDARPTLTPPTLPHALDGNAYSASIASAASDPDAGDTLTFTKLDGPAWLTVASDGTLSGTPGTADIGTAPVRVRVTDGSGLVDDETVSLTVDPPLNEPPTTPGTPALSSGTSPNAGVFALSWAGSIDPEGSPVTYTLQHRDADDAGFTDVATGLTSETHAFTAASREDEGTWRYRVRASDGELDSGASGESDQVKVDRSAPLAPTLSADRAPDYAGGGGWYRDTVTVSFAHNGDPVLADGSSGSGVDPSSVPGPAVRSTSGSHVVAGHVVDHAGNTSAPAGLTVQVDATNPSVSITCPASTPTQGSTASAPWSASDAHSGLATPASGTLALDTSTPGPKTATAPTATDNVGRTGSASCTYTVQSAGTYDSAVRADNPLYRWRLGEPSGTAMTAAAGGRTGNYQNNVVLGQPSGLPGDSNTAALFNGISSYAYVNGIGAPSLAYTLEIRMKANPALQAGTLIDQGGAGALYIRTDRFCFRQTSVHVCWMQPPTTGAWYHVAGTWDSAFRIARLYVNGVERASALASTAPSGSGTLYVGYGQSAPWFKGLLDEPAYYATALSAARIAAHHAACGC